MSRRRKHSPSRAAFRRVRRHGVELILARPFERFPWLVHGFTLRRGSSGDFNLGFGSKFPATEVRANRALLLEALSAHSIELIALRQIHSAMIHALDGPPAQPLTGDALMTRRRGLLLAVQVADCLPILLVDRQRRVVAAVHAGWRGTLARIAEKAVGRMRAEFGTKPQDILVAIGPGIHACCYEVGEEVITGYESQFRYAADLLAPAREIATRAARRGGWNPPLDPIARKIPLAPGHDRPRERKAHLDLVKANRRQLVDAGISGRRIFAHPDCTACKPERYFSYRKEGPTGRMMGVIGIRDPVLQG